MTEVSLRISFKLISIKDLKALNETACYVQKQRQLIERGWKDHGFKKQPAFLFMDQHGWTYCLALKKDEEVDWDALTEMQKQVEEKQYQRNFALENFFKAYSSSCQSELLKDKLKTAIKESFTSPVSLNIFEFPISFGDDGMTHDCFELLTWFKSNTDAASQEDGRTLAPFSSPNDSRVLIDVRKLRINQDVLNLIELYQLEVNGLKQLHDHRSYILSKMDTNEVKYLLSDLQCHFLQSKEPLSLFSIVRYGFLNDVINVLAYLASSSVVVGLLIGASVLCFSSGAAPVALVAAVLTLGVITAASAVTFFFYKYVSMVKEICEIQDDEHIRYQQFKYDQRQCATYIEKLESFKTELGKTVKNTSTSSDEVLSSQATSSSKHANNGLNFFDPATNQKIENAIKAGFTVKITLC